MNHFLAGGLLEQLEFCFRTTSTNVRDNVIALERVDSLVLPFRRMAARREIEKFRPGINLLALVHQSSTNIHRCLIPSASSRGQGATTAIPQTSPTGVSDLCLGLAVRRNVSTI